MEYKEIPKDEDGNIQIEKLEFPILYPLLAPIPADGSQLQEVSLREPTVRDVEVSQKEKSGLPTASRMLTLIADLSPEQVRSMGSRDFARISEVVTSFL